MQAISRLSETEDLREIIEMLCQAAMVIVVTLVAGGVVIAWLCTRKSAAPPAAAAAAPKAVVVWIMLRDSKDESLYQMEEEIVPLMPFHVVYLCLSDVTKVYNTGRPLPPAEFVSIKHKATAFATKVKHLAEGPVSTTNLDTLTFALKSSYGETDIDAYCQAVLRAPPVQGSIKAKHFDRVLQWNGLTFFILKHAMCAFNRALPAVINRQRRAIQY